MVAGFGLHRYAWPATLLITVPWFLHRRVPRFAVANVSFHRALGRMAVRADGFACLPDDPAAALPGARVVPDEEALRAEVRAAVAAHVGPLLDGFGPRMRRRSRALWSVATTRSSRRCGTSRTSSATSAAPTTELELLLPGATKPYVGTAGFRELTGPDGQTLPTRDRASCCMFYTLRPEDACVTCPRTCDAERVARLSAAATAG